MGGSPRHREVTLDHRANHPEVAIDYGVVGVRWVCISTSTAPTEPSAHRSTERLRCWAGLHVPWEATLPSLTCGDELSSCLPHLEVAGSCFGKTNVCFDLFLNCGGETCSPLKTLITLFRSYKTQLQSVHGASEESCCAGRGCCAHLSCFSSRTLPSRFFSPSRAVAGLLDRQY